MDLLAETAKLRFKVQDEELKLSKEKWEYEKTIRKDDLDLMTKKFEHEKLMDERRLKIEEDKLKNEFELAKYRVEQEFKHKLELAKLGFK